MAMRDLVTGGAACAVPGSPSSSNPLGALASKLVGSSSKQQERLKEIPTSATTIPENRLYPDTNERLTELPGSEFDNQLLPSVQNSRFLESFQSSDRSAFTNVWDEIQHPQAFLSQDRGHFQGHEYDGGVSSQPQSLFDGPPQRVLSTFLRSFIDSSRGAIPFQPSPVPVLGLSEGDKQCIRDRSSIMARHFFADRSEDFINAQVNALLCSLDIDNDMRAKQPIPGRFRELEEYWNESQGPLNAVPHSEDRWVAEYRQQNAERADPSAWVHSFEQQHGANGWASEFDQEQSQMASLKQVNTPGFAALEQTRMLADTLAQNDDPKFQNSKFLQFVSKMSRGELIIDDNQVKPREIPAKTDWVAEYEQGGRGVDWANQFAENNAVNMSERWVDEFGTEYGQHATADDPWVDEFSKLHIQDWAKEYEQQLDNNTADTWAGAYDEFLDEQAAAKNSSKGVYVFSDMNPYVGHPAPLKQGQELFQNGLLSEAVLALEAEVLKNPNNAEGWRLLGITHAENDDDQQAIAAMICAQEAVPTHLEVLLALGVSHTNELEQTAALKYLYSWLHHHPKYRALATTPPSDSLYYADVARLFSEAAETSPEDADVHIVLGVLYNLSRKYDKAVASFQKALQLRPHDYSLWNKLGATQANSVQCASAIEAYQQALDLKPNYVRAWANMGISYANQSLYEDSIRYYVRAVTMNPKADNVWRYLRISLSHASRTDMVEACDSRNIDVLQKEFPLY